MPGRVGVDLAQVAELLVAVIKDQSEDEPIVPSATVRWHFEQEGSDGLLQERARSPEANFNGRGFQRADHEACASGLLVKWKRSAEKQREIGWSLPAGPGTAAEARVEAWAKRKGWRRAQPDDE